MFLAYEKDYSCCQIYVRSLTWHAVYILIRPCVGHKEVKQTTENLIWNQSPILVRA